MMTNVTHRRDLLGNRRIGEYLIDNPQEEMGALESLWEGTKHGLKYGNVTTSTIYSGTQRRGGEVDEDFSVDPASLILQYNTDEVNYLRNAVNQDEFNARVKDIQEERASFEAIAQAGLTGGAAAMVVSVLDPAMWVATKATFGLATGAKVAKSASVMSKTAAFARGAIVGSAEAALYESYLASNAISQDNFNIYNAAIAGGLIGGAVNVLARNKKFNELRKLEADDQLLRDLAAKNIADEVKTLKKREGFSDLVLAGEDEYQRLLKGFNEAPVPAPRATKNELLEQVRSNMKKEMPEVMSNNQRVKLQSRLKTLKNSIPRINKKLKGIKIPRKKTKKVIEAGLGNPKTRKEAEKLLSEFNKRNDLNRELRQAKRELSKIEETLDRAVSEKLINDEINRLRYLDDTELTLELREMGLDYDPTPFIPREAPKRSQWLQDAIDRLGGDEYLAARKPITDDASAFSEFADSGKHVTDGRTTAPDGATSTIDAKIVSGQLADEAIAASARIEGMVDVSKFVGKALASIGNRLVKSDNKAIQGLSLRFFEMAQGGSNASTVDSVISNLQTQAYTRLSGAIDIGFTMHLEDMGLTKARLLGEPAQRREFYKDVMRYQSSPESYPGASRGVRHTAKHIAEMQEYMYSFAEREGVRGFTKSNRVKNYVTTLMDSNLIEGAIANPSIGREGVRELLSEAWFQGVNQIPKDQGLIIADLVIDQQLKKNLPSTKTGRGATSVDIDSITRQLKKTGMPDEEVNKYVQTLIDDAADASINDRAKASMGANLSVTTTMPDGTTLSMVDLVETDLARLTNGYISSLSADIGMAVHGFKSRAELDSVLDQIYKNALKTEGKEAAMETLDDINLFRRAVDVQQGKTLDPDPSGAMTSNMRRLREFAGVMMGGKLGLNAFQDVYRSIVDNGITNVVKSMHQMKMLNSEEFLTNMTKSREHLNPIWREMYETIGYSGFDDALRAVSLGADFGEGVANHGAGALVDMLLKKGNRVGSNLSGLTHVMRFVDQVTARSSYMNISSQILGGNLSPRSLRLMGWTAEQGEAFVEAARAAKTRHWFDGNPIDVISFNKLSHKDRRMFSEALDRVNRRASQKMSVGETPEIMHKEFGKLLMQYKSFSLGALEKQLIFDAKSGLSKVVQMSLLSVGAAYLTHAVRTVANSAREDRPASYIHKQLTGSNAFWGTVGMTGQLAPLTIAAGFAASLGVLPESMQASGDRLGIKPAGIADSIPALSVADRTISNTGSAISSLLEGDVRGALTSGSKMLPYLQSTSALPIMALINAYTD